MTRTLYVIGDPIAHSLSPAIHTLWLRAAGIKATYKALHVPSGALLPALDRLEAEGALGANITLPHKEDALVASADASLTARAIGAVNTLSRHESDGWRGDNTDAPGLMRALYRAGEQSLSGRTVLVIGAGGAARAAVYALAEAGAQLTIVNRTVSRAEALSTDLTGGQAGVSPMTELAREAAHCDIVINTSSAGHKGESFALPEGSGRLFFDSSYGRAAAPQLRAATAAGWRARDGLSMLVAQAAYAFEIWFGQSPDEDRALKHVRLLVETSS